ncbi:hypothetical protein Hdeb2414_s0001g00017111 [Helianthus debilis subsp. tardiflorus]
MRSSSLMSEPLLIPTAPSSSRVRDKTPEISAARITLAFEVSPLHATVTSKPSHLEVCPFVRGFFWGAGMLQRVDELRRENEGLRGDLKTSQTVAAELQCWVIDAERRLQEEKREGAWARERATLVEEKEDLAAELRHQKELNSVSQKDPDAMYAKWGVTSNDNQKLAQERYQSGLKDGYAYSAQGLGRKETPLYNSKAKKRLSKLDKEFGGKTPAILEKILERPLMSIDELKALLAPASPSSPKSLSGDDSQ